MAEPAAETSLVRRSFGSSLMGTILGAVIGAGAALLGGAQANHTQAQLQSQATRRTVYAEFLGSSANWCSVLQARPVDADRSNAELNTFAQSIGAVVLVAPDNVTAAAQKINDYLVVAAGLHGQPATGCDYKTFYVLYNQFLAVAKKELGY
jgi:hypothetical protein